MQTLQNDSMDLESYLASLELHVTMRSATTADMPRIAQLTQKTNQFNLSLRRRSEAELCRLPAEYHIYVIEVTDRLGDYGLVGVCILVRPSGASECVEIETLLVSCRALGRGVEDAVLSGIQEIADAWGRHHLEAGWVVGPRNQPVGDFLQRLSFVSMGPGRFSRSRNAAVPLPRHISWVGPLNNNSSGPKAVMDHFERTKSRDTTGSADR